MSINLVHTISMSAGCYIDISFPTSYEDGSGAFPKDESETITIDGKDVPHVYGFISEDTNIGTVAKINGSQELKVRYTHLKGECNRIFFYTANDEKFIISIIATPIHDHSTVQQGGPAYGTYYYDANKKSTT